MDDPARVGDNNAAPLYWDSSYELVLALLEAYPDCDIDNLGLRQLKDMIIRLPNFADDPAFGYEELLREILREWYEEATADV